MDITRQLERTFGTAGTEERRVSWEAAQEIKRLRGALGDIRELCLSPPADISPEVLLNIVAIRTEIGVAMLSHPAEFELFRLSDIPVPPMLSEAVGYRGDNRYIGLWWDQSGDELVLSDGAKTLCGGSHDAYFLFACHSSVVSHLFGYRLGTDGPANHALLLDRQENIIYSGRLENVQHFLGVVSAEGRPSQSQQQLLLKVGQNDLQNLAKRFFESDTLPSPEALGKRMAEEHSRVCAEMKTWLNQAQTHSSAPRG